VNGTSIELNNQGSSNQMRICQWTGGNGTNYDGSVLNYDAWNGVVYVSTGNAVAVYVNGVLQSLTTPGHVQGHDR
jgi:hypothetical protein